MHSVNALAALGKCSRLRYLDLSLVSEAFTAAEVVHTIPKLTNLKTFLFPRAGKERWEVLYSCWPQSLQECIVRGGLRGTYNLGAGSWLDTKHNSLYIPPKRQSHNLVRLTVGNCDLGSFDITRLVSSDYLPRLKYLKVVQPMKALQANPFRAEWTIPESNPLAKSSIRHLDVPIEYLSPSVCQNAKSAAHTKLYLLETLRLRDTNEDLPWDQEAWDFALISDAVDEGPFKRLRRISMPRTLFEYLSKDSDPQELDQFMKALAREDGEQSKYTEDEAGVRITDD